ncbi:MAG: cytochrome c3 family protein [Desulfuromonadaceae bacterium]|nr:cytochrome c3 family protein [Desulfuromonadaceae bacterium]
MYRLLLMTLMLLIPLSAWATEPAGAFSLGKALSAVQQQKQQVDQVVTEEAEKAPAAEAVATEPAISPASSATQAALANVGTPTPEATAIYAILLKNNFGDVQFNHMNHAEKMSCATCHPTTPPGKIELTKKQFHATCRSCHINSGSGPSKCRACHAR